MPEEFTYTFTDEEREDLMLRLDLLVKYLNEDLTMSEDSRNAFIQATKELRKKIEYNYN